jgi:hypothetical protein
MMPINQFEKGNSMDAAFTLARNAVNVTYNDFAAGPSVNPHPDFIVLWSNINN